MNRTNLNSAALNTSGIDSTIRVLVNAYAYALASVQARVHRGAVTHAEARAEIEARATALVRSKIDVVAQAQQTMLARVLRRATMIVEGIATLGVVPSAVRVAVELVAAASIAAVGRVIRRQPVSLSDVASASVIARRLVMQPSEIAGQATVDVLARALRIAPTVTTGRADVVIDTSIVRRVQFDEPAIESQTFVVPFETNVFYVS